MNRLSDMRSQRKRHFFLKTKLQPFFSVLNQHLKKKINSQEQNALPDSTAQAVL